MDKVETERIERKYYSLSMFSVFSRVSSGLKWVVMMQPCDPDGDEFQKWRETWC